MYINMDDKTRYNAMEQTLKSINEDYISLSKSEMKRNNAVLNEVLTEIIEGCQNTSELFKKMYSGIFYGGSYYDGLKIKPPDEYDIDVKFKIPYRGPIEPSNKCGFVNLQLQPLQDDNPKWNRKHHLNVPFYGVRGMHVLADYYDHYLDTEKVRIWMHQVLSTWIEGWKCGKDRISQIDTPSYGRLKVKFRRNGPAFTFRVTVSAKHVICFDLVPCFEFSGDQWPSSGFRSNPVDDKSEFFIVPKPLNEPKGTRYWRMSFQEQERVLINSKDKLKLSLRLIKKISDKLKHKCIASYFVKTVFLWEVFECRQPDFWSKSLSYVFMEVLKDYHQCIKNGRIDYFWYKKFNLIQSVNNMTLMEINRELKNIITNLENDPDNPVLVAKCFLSRKELKNFRRKLVEE